MTFKDYLLLVRSILFPSTLPRSILLVLLLETSARFRLGNREGSYTLTPNCTHKCRLESGKLSRIQSSLWQQHLLRLTGSDSRPRRGEPVPDGTQLGSVISPSRPEGKRSLTNSGSSRSSPDDCETGVDSPDYIAISTLAGSCKSTNWIRDQVMRVLRQWYIHVRLSQAAVESRL
ncbi:unnamed protein product [Protopolystoma xenopodis]|uniref:Uncharacterized protein n=1 Tax=Protopolystoma xenopodis TaxID=117903 RepID=A0A3S5BXG0_9PLAT|nr:unnamed protein product [Protopolystoma xenopodis]